jgi:flagellar hook-length control protein FliK
MQLTPELRPSGLIVERQGDTARDRGAVDAPDSRTRFDEHLQQAADAEPSLRSKPEREKSESAPADRAAREAHGRRPAAQAPEAATPPAQKKPAAAGPVQTPSAEALAPQAQTAAEATGVTHKPAIAAALDASEPSTAQAAESELQLEPQAPETALAQTEATPAPQTGAHKLQTASALLLAQQNQQPPSEGLVRPTANAASSATPLESAGADEAPVALPKFSADGAQPAPALSGDESLRAGLSLRDGARDFAGELERLGESAAAKAPQRASAHQEQAAEILRQVRVALSPDLREANIQLSPESLGRIFIRLRVVHGVLTADVRAQTPEALLALERQAPELKAALAGNGVEARNLNFTLDTSTSHSGANSGRGQQAHGQAARRHLNQFLTAPAALERALTRGLSNSGIDTFA